MLDRTVTWLHLSDLHTCKPETGWDACRVLKSLKTDLQSMQNNYGLRPDLIFFTGDLVYGQLADESGMRITDQFNDAVLFLEEVRTAFNPEVPKDRIFLVPGNHDVNCDKATNKQKDWLQRQKSTELITNIIRDKDTQWLCYMERLEDFCNFLKENDYDHLLNDSDRLISHHIRNINGTKIGIACLNSAWSYSKDVGKGHLWLGLDWQAETLLANLDDADYKIALIHHPLDWYVEYEGHSVWRKRIYQNFNFCLHGHEHSSWVEPIDLSTRFYITIAAGACYDRSDKDSGYNFVTLNLNSGSGDVWLRKYDDKGGGWIPDIIANTTDDRGVRWILFDKDIDANLKRKANKQRLELNAERYFQQIKAEFDVLEFPKGFNIAEGLEAWVKTNEMDMNVDLKLKVYKFLIDIAIRKAKHKTKIGEKIDMFEARIYLEKIKNVTSQ